MTTFDNNALLDAQNQAIPESLAFLVRGYSDYSKDVVIDRAIDGIDGFKPSQRRIAYTMHALEKVKDFTKCQSIAGAVLKLHPHGDGAVYDAMVRMVDTSEYMPTPFLAGKGNFGKVYANDPPAASRYTNAKFTPLASELFGLMDGVKFIPSYDNKLEEPVLLPVSFPNLLTNPVSGIAVGLATDRPSYNFHEVNNAVIEYITTGDIKTVLYPDFTTSGYVVADEKEMQKIMDTGRGRFKLRGKWFIDGKTIVIEEIPYYTTENALKTKIENEVEGVMEVRVETDRENGLQIAVECSRKKDVEIVLNQILRITDLQMTRMTNMVVIIDNKPRIIGIKEIIHEWVKFRKGVVERAYTKEREGLLASIDRYTVFTELLGDDERRLKFTGALSQEGEASARKLLQEWYPTTSKDVFDWILDMKLKQFSNLPKNLNTLSGYKNRLAEVESFLGDVDGYIVNELKALNNKYKFPRKTVITEEDYVFEDEVKTVVKAEAIPVILQVNDKFVKKIRHNRLTDNVDGIRCMSDDVVSFIDTQGRLLRLALENIDFNAEAERGTYLPMYLEVEDDFDIVAYEIIQDKKVGYVYSDGFASIVDYAEWVDAKRTTRITQHGVSTLAGSIMGEIDFSYNYLMLLTDDGKFGFARTDFKHKHRTARTKLVSMKKTEAITSVISLSYADILKLVSAPERYMDKISTLAKGDSFNTEYFNELVNR